MNDKIRIVILSDFEAASEFSAAVKSILGDAVELVHIDEVDQELFDEICRPKDSVVQLLEDLQKLQYDQPQCIEKIPASSSMPQIKKSLYKMPNTQQQYLKKWQPK